MGRTSISVLVNSEEINTYRLQLFFHAGTRWMQELVWRVRNDHQLVSTEKLNFRVPFIE